MSDRGLLLLRADASPKIGAGHVMRCLALAQAWRSAGGAFAFASRAMPASLAERIRDEGGEVLRIEDGADDVQSTVSIIDRCKASVVVLDGYSLTTEHHWRCRQAGAVTVVIDDTGEHRAYECDIVVNQNLHASEELYVHRAEHCTLLLGVRYTLLRQEFLRYGSRTRETPEVASRVLLSFGGADIGGLSLRAVDALAREPGDYLLLLGAAHPERARVEALARSAENVRVMFDVKDVSPWMQWAHMAVVAAGSTVWELAFMGVPAIVIPVADNQRGVAREAQRLGLALSLEHEQDLSTERLRSVIRDLRRDSASRRRMTTTGQATIDGFGAERVVSAITRAQGSLR